MTMKMQVFEITWPQFVYIVTSMLDKNPLPEQKI